MVTPDTGWLSAMRLSQTQLQNKPIHGEKQAQNKTRRQQETGGARRRGGYSHPSPKRRAISACAWQVSLGPRNGITEYRTVAGILAIR